MTIKKIFTSGLDCVKPAYGMKSTTSTRIQTTGPGWDPKVRK